jgi:hypothetical protein
LECRELRNRIPWMLFTRGTQDDREALKVLVKKHRSVRPWYQRAVAEYAVRQSLGAPPFTLADTRHIFPYQDVVEILQNADYRIIRNALDLLDTVEELLRQIGSEIGRHIEMLYLPRELLKWTQRHESALQSYVECRLSDLIPTRVPGTTITFHREAQGRMRQRTDILVCAPRLNGGLAEVIIEVKWSKNPEIANALARQLGGRYLLKEKQTHGIYLVGWNGVLGRWLPAGGPPPAKPVTVQSLEAALAQQAAAFGAKHPACVIRPVVFDAAWPDAPSSKKAGQTKRRRRSTRKSARKRR